jgi:hypothetical protein
MCRDKVAMRADGGVEVQLHSFVTWVLDEVEWSASAALPLQKEPPLPPSTAGWEGARASQDTVENRRISFPGQGSKHNSLVVQPIAQSLKLSLY